MRSWFTKTQHHDSTDLPLYQRRSEFLGDADRALFNALQEVAGKAYQVLAKVKLSELVEPKVDSGNRVHQMHWIKVHRLCLDFLVCRGRDMEPVVAIRLLPKAEYLKRRLARYDVMDVVLRDIGLPKLTVVEQKTYDPDSLRKKLRMAMAANQGRETPPGGRGGGSSVGSGAS